MVHRRVKLYRRGMTRVLHLISIPFPWFWHTLEDNGANLDLPTIVRWGQKRTVCHEKSSARFKMDGEDWRRHKSSAFEQSAKIREKIEDVASNRVKGTVLQVHNTYFICFTLNAKVRSQNYRWQNGKVRFRIPPHLKVALPRHIEESSSRQEGRVQSKGQSVTKSGRRDLRWMGRTDVDISLQHSSSLLKFEKKLRTLLVIELKGQCYKSITHILFVSL